ncbi:hypothetical protein FOA52_002705 [Chlamydomonas sp. UWO 241]|nr:hypothetical protein FOA52_002705 [Chlamydomonas sp. UWO 241]
MLASRQTGGGGKPGAESSADPDENFRPWVPTPGAPGRSEASSEREDSDVVTLPEISDRGRPSRAPRPPSSERPDTRDSERPVTRERGSAREQRTETRGSDAVSGGRPLTRQAPKRPGAQVPDARGRPVQTPAYGRRLSDPADAPSADRSTMGGPPQRRLSEPNPRAGDDGPPIGMGPPCHARADALLKEAEEMRAARMAREASRQGPRPTVVPLPAYRLEPMPPAEKRDAKPTNATLRKALEDLGEKHGPAPRRSASVRASTSAQTAVPTRTTYSAQTEAAVSSQTVSSRKVEAYLEQMEDHQDIGLDQQDVDHQDRDGPNWGREEVEPANRRETPRAAAPPGARKNVAAAAAIAAAPSRGGARAGGASGVAAGRKGLAGRGASAAAACARAAPRATPRSRDGSDGSAHGGRSDAGEEEEVGGWGMRRMPSERLAAEISQDAAFPPTRKPQPRPRSGTKVGPKVTARMGSAKVSPRMDPLEDFDEEPPVYLNTKQRKRWEQRRASMQSGQFPAYRRSSTPPSPGGGGGSPTGAFSPRSLSGRNRRDGSSGGGVRGSFGSGARGSFGSGGGGVRKSRGFWVGAGPRVDIAGPTEDEISGRRQWAIERQSRELHREASRKSYVEL